MSTTSRNQRRKSRITRTNSLLKRALRTEQQQRAHALMILFAVLAQKGGEAIITKGTLDQAVQNARHLAYELHPGSDVDELIVRLVPTDQSATTQAIQYDDSPILPEGTCSAPVEVHSETEAS